MRKIRVSGTTTTEIMQIFSDSIIYGKSSKIVVYNHAKHTVFEVIIDKIDATIWHLPKSVFFNDKKLKKTLVLHGWINKEKRKRFSSTVSKNCTIDFYANEDMILKIKKKKGKEIENKETI